MLGGVAAAVLFAQPFYEQLGESTEIYICTAIHLGGGNRRLIAARQQQRRPFADRVAILSVLHAAEKMMGTHALVP